MGPRDQILAQEYEDFQADQTINEQLKIAATELKNPSIQQKSAYRSQTTSMPSLTQLATINTHSTEYVFPEDPSYSMDTTEPPLEEPNVTHGSSIKDIKYEGLLTPSLLYQAHLEYKIRGHREVDLSLADDIHKVVQRHSANHLDFNAFTTLKRDILLQRLSGVYNLQHLKPTIYKVLIQEKTVLTSVAVFDLHAQILSIVHNAKLMQQENFAPDYDVFTGKPTTPITHFGEVHTGELFEPARAKYCGDDPTNMPCPLILFYDKTFVDLHGSLACSPVIMWPTFFKQECRNKLKFARVLGYVPNLTLGKGGSSVQTSIQKVQDEHNCLKHIFDQIATKYNDGGIKTNVMGRQVTLKIWIHLITGDTSGHNDLCGHVNSGSSNIPIRNCGCTWDDLDEPDPDCQFTTLQALEDAEGDKKQLSLLGKKKIKSCFDGIPLGDDIYGIMGITPPEMLHVAGTGIFKYMFSCITNILHQKTTKKEKEAFDKLHQVLASQSTHQSEMDFPRTSVRNGITDGSKMGGMERVGNLAILLCVTYTKEGRDLMRDGLRGRNTSMKDTQRCMKLMLSFFQWVHDPSLKANHAKARLLVVEMLTLLKRCFPRGDGNGWNIPKFHLWTQMLRFVQRFGSASVFDGGTGERFLKSIVKDLIRNTQKVPAKLVEQLSQRKYELDVIDHAFEFGVMKALDLDYEYVNMEEKETLKGEYRLLFGPMDQHGKSSVGIDWTDKKRNKVKLDVHAHLKMVIKKFALDQKYHGAFQVVGYTSYQTKFDGDALHTKFHANEYTHGGPWYDWCMIQFHQNDILASQSMSPAKIIGFVRYESRGIPTPYLIQDEGVTLEEIEESNMEDETMYAIIHTASQWLTMDTLESEFSETFLLGDVNQCLYIVDVKTIIAPLFVVANENDLTMICMLPKKKWGKFFDRCLDEL